MTSLVAHGWNVEQILVYFWQLLLRGEGSKQEYPYLKFVNSEAGTRLRIELKLLADMRLLTAEDVTNIVGPVLYPGRMADMLNARIAERKTQSGAGRERGEKGT